MLNRYMLPREPSGLPWHVAVPAALNVCCQDAFLWLYSALLNSGIPHTEHLAVLMSLKTGDWWCATCGCQEGASGHCQTPRGPCG